MEGDDRQTMELEDTLRDSPTQNLEEDLSPESYRVNSANETRMLNIAHNFQRQFSFLFPERTPLLLCPVNECGVKKFVSTTLRPTPTSHPELFTWEGCSSFVADFLSLVPLDPPEDLPRTLFSPTAVLRTQTATCFEFATLLCSLLMGVDYEAYCVSGFAVKEMCLLDQSRQECPLLDTQDKFVQSESPQQEDRYAVKPQRALKSRFVLQQEKKKVDAEAELLHPEPQEQGEQRPVDPLRGLRRHCWVLVLSGSRSIQENFFIDPLTGNSYSTDHDNFLGVDSVWDCFNFYVNMQDCSGGCANMVYDLEDVNLWEPVLFGAATKKQLILQASLRREMKMRMNMNTDELEEEPRVFQMPRSWVGSINISKKDLEDRWPGKSRVTLYRKAKLERFAADLRSDGLVRRLTVYRDLNCSEVVKVLEWYQNRKDHLEEREVNKVDKVTSERFKPGRQFQLLFYRHTDTVKEMKFSRPRFGDLVWRVESPGELKECYDGRRDLLYYRYAVFDPFVPFSENLNCDQSQKWLQKVVERFHRNTSKPANQDVAERVFLLDQRRIEVTYHTEDHRVVPSKRIFVKPREATEEKKAESFKRDMVEEFQMLNSLKEDEEEVVRQIKLSRREVRDIEVCRQLEQTHVELVSSIWTLRGEARARSQREETRRLNAEEQTRLQEKKNDILAAFLTDRDRPENLGAARAKELFDTCLSNYRERQVERINLIQERYKKETQELQRKQQWYHQNQLSMTDRQKGEYRTYCREKTLQIHDVRERLRTHRAEAPQKYSYFYKKLMEDPRLAPHL
ncbi:dynein regulatory complex subunit 7 isoform X3 [Xyrichtys novacula]|uniref:Dynein regulatory complex subunit 7 n=1 Tax=Xyrichtys novacula TaxID=13765 RepID=A0AAV1HGZ7_XYRNO|nr:dynein regulatory complex subunit 7 isoform X3 [Xyrichtys novacula]